jgi:hypothetical protein
MVSNNDIDFFPKYPRIMWCIRWMNPSCFTGHDAYKNLEPESLKSLMGTNNPLIMDGRNSINPDAFIAAGFVYQGIGRCDKNSHRLVR